MSPSIEFEQPGLPPPPPGYNKKRKPKHVQPMTSEGEALADWAKELYWVASARHDHTHERQGLGPSELGDPCQHKLARKLLGLSPVNQSRQDSWAATVGTAVHAWLATEVALYGGSTDRFLIEHNIEIPTQVGPIKGQLDLYDRRKRTVIDHKVLGDATLDRLRDKNDPGWTYYVQIQLYAYGLQLQGEQPETVAIIGWPRTESTLNKLYVWTAKFSPDAAREAIDEYENLLHSVLPNHPERTLEMIPPKPGLYCKYCPFYRKVVNSVIEGCTANGE